MIEMSLKYVAFLPVSRERQGTHIMAVTDMKHLCHEITIITKSGFIATGFLKIP